jgi:hypothetical protein
MRLRLVLDTNVWLDWLVFDDPGVRPLKAAVAAGEAEVFTASGCQQELERVICYPLGKRPHRVPRGISPGRKFAANFATSCNDAFAGVP